MPGEPEAWESSPGAGRWLQTRVLGPEVTVWVSPPAPDQLCKSQESLMKEEVRCRGKLMRPGDALGSNPTPVSPRLWTLCKWSPLSKPQFPPL